MTPRSLDVRAGVLELGAQPAHRDVEGLGGAEPVLVPHGGHQRLAGHDRPALGVEEGQHAELLGGQGQLLLADPDPASGGVDAQGAGGGGPGGSGGGVSGRRAARCWSRRGRGCVRLVGTGRRGRAAQGARRPAGQRPDAGLHLRDRERLGQVVVGPVVQPHDPVELVGAGGEDHDPAVVPLLAGLAAHVEPVHVGQAEVEQHHVRDRADRVEGLGPRGHPGHGVPLPLEHPLQRQRDVLVVLDDEDGRGGPGSGGGHGCSLGVTGPGRWRRTRSPAWSSRPLHRCCARSPRGSTAWPRPWCWSAGRWRCWCRA